jgi:hypothetical protein
VVEQKVESVGIIRFISLHQVDAWDASALRTPLRGGLDFPMSPPSTIRRGFRRLRRKHSAARDLQHDALPHKMRIQS